MIRRTPQEVREALAALLAEALSRIPEDEAVGGDDPLAFELPTTKAA